MLGLTEMEAAARLRRPRPAPGEAGGGEGVEGVEGEVTAASSPRGRSRPREGRARGRARPPPRCGSDGRTGAARRRGTALALIARAVGARAVGRPGGAGEAEEAELADFHAGPQSDGHGGRIAQLEGDVPGEAGVDESGGGMGEQPEPAQARLALQTGGDVVGQGDALIGGAEDELTGVEDEGLVGADVDQVGEAVLVDGGVDDRVPVVVEKAEPPIQAHVDRGGLNHLRVVGVEDDAPGVELSEDVAIGEEHECDCARGRALASAGRDVRRAGGGRPPARGRVSSTAARRGRPRPTGASRAGRTG